MGVQHEDEARQLAREISKRLKAFGLTLSPEKTSIKEFGRFADENQRKKGRRKAETFDFLGFTHYCSITQDGRFKLGVKTSHKKLNKGVQVMDTFLKNVRNLKHPKEIWMILKSKLQGHYNYYGVSGNIEEMKRYYEKTKTRIFYWYNRKSQRERWNREEFSNYLIRYPLPVPKLTYAIYNTW